MTTLNIDHLIADPVALQAWIDGATEGDLKTLIMAIDLIATRCHSELARRAWDQHPRTYRRGSLA